MNLYDIFVMSFSSSFATNVYLLFIAYVLVQIRDKGIGQDVK